MMTGGTNISENSRRIAKNTFFLYFRMLLMLCIGLFTSRVILKTLGVDDYGTYNAVGGLVTMFTFVTAAVSNAISRFLAVELGRGDMDRLRRVFSSSVIIQMALSVLLALLVETAGLWLLHHRMVIPDGRMGAADLVLHSSLILLIINLMSIPYNAAIIAHEKMSAYALISILEAVLKLTVALSLYFSPYDKLKTYALLMTAVALITRIAYGTYARRSFDEVRGRPVWDPALIREMSGFAGWSFFGASANVFSSQGVNLITNLFFGVRVNAARGVAAQVEGMVKPFVTNVLTAFNPQITKSYSTGDRRYCEILVFQASKFSFLIMSVFVLPVLFEADMLLQLWLGDVPEYAAVFVRLTPLCLLADLLTNPVHTLQLATGRLRRFYLVTGLTLYMVMPLSWLVFKLGAPPAASYAVYMLVYSISGVLRVRIQHEQTGFDARGYLRQTLRLILVLALSAVLPWVVWTSLRAGVSRLILVCLTSWISLAGSSWFLVLSEGERSFIKSKISSYVPAK